MIQGGWHPGKQASLVRRLLRRAVSMVSLGGLCPCSPNLKWSLCFWDHTLLSSSDSLGGVHLSLPRTFSKLGDLFAQMSQWGVQCWWHQMRSNQDAYDSAQSEESAPDVNSAHFPEPWSRQWVRVVMQDKLQGHARHDIYQVSDLGQVSCSFPDALFCKKEAH